jgi:hypothetical protein
MQYDTPLYVNRRSVPIDWGGNSYLGAGALRAGDAVRDTTRPDHIIINHISPHRGKRTNINTHVHATTCLAITNAIRGALPLRNAHDPIAWIYSRPRSGVAAGRSVL